MDRESAGRERVGQAVGPIPASRSAEAVDVAIAEFNALRAEIISRMTAQAALVGIGLTAVGVILGLSVGEEGNKSLPLAIPAIALLVNTLSTAQTHRINLIGTYIRQSIWPFLRDQAGRELKSWEDDVAGRRASPAYALVVLLVDAPAILVFVVASVLALALGDQHGGLVVGGWVATAVALLVPMGVSGWHTYRA